MKFVFWYLYKRPGRLVYYWLRGVLGLKRCKSWPNISLQETWPVQCDKPWEREEVQLYWVRPAAPREGCRGRWREMKREGWRDGRPAASGEGWIGKGWGREGTGWKSSCAYFDNWSFSAKASFFSISDAHCQKGRGKCQSDPLEKWNKKSEIWFQTKTKSYF